MKTNKIPFDKNTGEYLRHTPRERDFPGQKTSVFTGSVAIIYLNLYVIRLGDELVRDARGTPLAFRSARTAKKSVAWTDGAKTVRAGNLPKKIRI